MNPTVKQLIEELKLTPHPEGGYYREIYRSTDMIISSKHLSGKRCATTAIYYLLSSSDFSAWHRLKSDELWHFYYGCPLKLYILDKNKNLTTHTLGNPLATPDAHFQITIPANHWFAATPHEGNSFTLVSCTMAPGFEFQDFELASKKKLIEEFPQHKIIIEKFLRD